MVSKWRLTSSASVNSALLLLSHFWRQVVVSFSSFLIFLVIWKCHFHLMALKSNAINSCKQQIHHNQQQSTQYTKPRSRNSPISQCYQQCLHWTKPKYITRLNHQRRLIDSISNKCREMLWWPWCLKTLGFDSAKHPNYPLFFNFNTISKLLTVNSKAAKQ